MRNSLCLAPVFLAGSAFQTGPRISQCGNHVDSKLFCPFDLSILSKARAGCNSKMSQKCANTFCSYNMLISCSNLLHADTLSRLEIIQWFLLCHMQHSTGYAWWWTFESNAQTTWCCLFAAADQQASLLHLTCCWENLCILCCSVTCAQSRACNCRFAHT